MSRWLIVGSGGMLGRDLLATLTTNGADVVGLTRRELDVTDRAAVRAAMRDCKPDVVVNCAARTGGDDAESHEAEAFRVNARGAAHLAADCVFAGDARRPYSEHDTAAPSSAYGRSKLAGELAVLRRLPHAAYIARTAWLYGAHGPNFVRTMIRLERERPA